MRTRCPACQTVFRVSAEQLRVRDGKVRCGHCRHVFNANNTLDTDDADPPAVAPPAESSGTLFVLEERPPREAGAKGQTSDATRAPARDVDSKDDSRVTGHAEAKARTGGTATQLKNGPAVGPSDGGTIPTALFIKKASAPEPKSIVARSTLRAPTAAPVAPLGPAKASAHERRGAGKYSAKSDDDRRFASDDDAAATPHAGATETEAAPPVLNSLAEAAVGPPRPPSTAGQTHPKALQEQYTSEPPEAPATRTPRNITPAAERASAADAQDIENGIAESPAPDERTSDTSSASESAEEPALAALDDLPAERSGNTLRMSLVAGALIAILGAQTGLVYRKALAQDMPSLRPFFTTLCANVGCSMALPRDADKIRIEISDLNRLPEKDDAFILSATLRNESKTAQAYPHLELTLTNAQDRAVARRVITPQEWMPTAPSERGFASREEIELVVPFTAAELGASGYRLYVFNP